MSLPFQIVPEKHQTTKSSPPKKTRKKRAKPASTNTANSTPVPGPVPASPASPKSESCSPAPGAVSPSAASSDGLWTLTIDEKPPPGVNLVLFVPVDPSSEMSTLPVAAVQALPQTSPLLSSNNLLGVNAAVGVPLNTSLEFIPGFIDAEAPLDLSKKCNSPKSAESDIPLLHVKSEPEEFDVSEQINPTENQVAKRQENSAETQETDGCSTGKRFKTEPEVLSPLSAQTASPELTADVKKAPPSPGSGFDLWSSTCSQLTRCEPEEKMKMEMDL